jgi:hypothetical protein
LIPQLTLFSLFPATNNMVPSDIIKRMQDAAASHDKQELGARETLLDLNRQLLAELETPTDFIQRIWFATVRSTLLTSSLLLI